MNFTDNGLDKTRVCPPFYLNRHKSNVFPSTVPSQQNNRGDRLLEGETRPPQWRDSEKRVNVSSWCLWDVAMFCIAQVAKLIYTCLPSAAMVYRLSSALRYSQVYLEYLKKHHWSRFAFTRAKMGEKQQAEFSVKPVQRCTFLRGHF